MGKGKTARKKGKEKAKRRRSRMRAVKELGRIFRRKQRVRLKSKKR